MNLIKHPDQRLQQTVKDFDFNSLDAKKIEHEMIQTMQTEMGIGLSANQVGLDAKIFVMQPHSVPGKTQPFAVINPVIQEASTDLVLMEEGCLSFPNLWLKIPRHNKITAMYLDNKGKQCIIELDGIDSRCFQHELDHLDGITFTEHVSNLKLNMARKKQRKLNG
jgi:peptide deformylase